MVLVASARDLVAASAALVFAPAVPQDRAVLPVAVMTVAPAPMTSEPAVEPTVQAAARRPAAMPRSSRGVRRT